MKSKRRYAGENTINDVASLAGVSKATVSRVINNNPGVSTELEQRVKKAIEELSYRPNKLAQALKARNTNSIGLIVPSVENPVFAQLTRVVENTAQKYGFATILCNSEGDIEKEAECIRLLLEKQVDGIIFDAIGVYSDTFQEVLKHHVPFVLVGRKIDNFPVANVNVDNRLGGYLATSHLIKTGCKRIVFMQAEHEALSAVNQRFLGYRDALDEHALPLDEKLMPKTRLTFESGARATEELLDQKVPFDAIFAANDLLALGCLDMLIERGIRVPEQVSIIGYDNIAFGGMARPRLSTVSNSVNTISVEAVKCVLRHIYSDNARTEEICFNPQLVLRQSTRNVF